VHDILPSRLKKDMILPSRSEKSMILPSRSEKDMILTEHIREGCIAYSMVLPEVGKQIFLKSANRKSANS
jgi:hypothetical protein